MQFDQLLHLFKYNRSHRYQYSNFRINIRDYDESENWGILKN